MQRRCPERLLLGTHRDLRGAFPPPHEARKWLVESESSGNQFLVIEEKLKKCLGQFLLHKETVNGAEDGTKFIYRAGRQIYSQDSGIVIPKHHTIAPFVSYYQKRAEMTPQRFQPRVALDKNAPAVAPGVTNEMARFLIVVLQANKVGGHDLQVWCDGATEQAGVLRVEAVQQQAKNPPVACGIDNHPRITSGAFRPEALLDSA